MYYFIDKLNEQIGIKLATKVSMPQHKAMMYALEIKEFKTYHLF